MNRSTMRSRAAISQQKRRQFTPGDVPLQMLQFAEETFYQFYDNQGNIIDWYDQKATLTATESHGEKSSLLDGSSQYWQLALPAELAGFNPSTISGGSAPTGWTKFYTPTITYETTESGSSGCMKMVAVGHSGVYINSGLVVGKKYKIALRYKSTNVLRVGYSASGNEFYELSATSEWCTATKILTYSGAGYISFNILSGTLFIESISVKLDQGFDLNRDQEQILHSKNWDFERTLGTELASGTVTIGSKYVVTAGTVEGNAVGTEFLAVTNATTLDASNKVKEIPNLISNGTFDSATGWSTPQQSSITGGVLSINHTSGIYVDYTGKFVTGLVLGKRYMISFEIKNYIQGKVTVNLGGYTAIAGQSGNGVKNVPLTISYNSDNNIYLSADSPFNFVGDIDNVHIYEIPEWTSTGNHTCNVSTLDKVGTTGQSLLISASGAGRGAELITNGTFDSNITGWTGTNGGVVTWESGRLKLTNNSNAYGRVNSTAFAVTSGKSYEVKINTTIAGTIYLVKSSDDVIVTSGATIVGDNNIILTSNFTGDVYLRASNSTANIGDFLTIDNISIKEILGEVTLPSANLESCVSGKKYTLEGFARLDPTTISYGSDLVSGVDFTSASWIATDVSVTKVDANSLSITTNNNGVYRAYLTVGKVYKVVTSGTVSGSIKLMEGGNILKTYPSNFSETFYFVATATTFNVRSAVAGTTTLDDFILTIQQADMVNLTAQLGTKSVTSSALSIVAGTFTKFVLNFEATASEVNQDLKLWLSGAGSVFVDKLSLTQSFDYALAFVPKDIDSARQNLFSNGLPYSANTQQGSEIVYESSNLSLYFSDGNNQVACAGARHLGSYANILGVFNRTANLTLYKNGVQIAQDSNYNRVGKVIHIWNTIFGARRDASDKWKGQISHLQIIRFENISQSTFNSAITGLQYPTGGGAEVVLCHDWSNIVGAISYDQSNRQNNLTAYGSPRLASADVLTVKDYSTTRKFAQSDRTKQPHYINGFDGTSDFITSTHNYGNAKTLVLKVNLSTLNRDIIRLSTGVKIAVDASGAVVTTGITSPAIFIVNADNMPVTTLATAADYVIIICSNTEFAINAPQIGYADTYFHGKIKYITAYPSFIADGYITQIFNYLTK